MAGNATLTLTDVVDQLKTNNKTQEATNKNLENYFKYLERQRLDQLENQREMKKGASSSTQRNASTGASSGGGFNLNLLSGFAASFAALGAALAGFRGWEVDAIKAIGRGLRQFKTNLMQGVRNIGINILRALGIEDIQKRDANHWRSAASVLCDHRARPRPDIRAGHVSGGHAVGGE